jgi:hypothetical protein
MIHRRKNGTYLSGLKWFMIGQFGDVNHFHQALILRMHHPNNP